MRLHVQGKGYGPKTDVWALGCILYELCTLKKAFDAPNLGAITIRIMRWDASSKHACQINLGYRSCNQVHLPCNGQPHPAIHSRLC